MASNCECHIAASFPVFHNKGIISATLRTNADVIVTEDNIVLHGPTMGDFSMSGYAPLNTGEVLLCPGKAGVNFQWEQKTDCDDEGFKTYFIPRGKAKSYTEGTVTNSITMQSVAVYDSFSASAASGPHSMYLSSLHYDGYNFYYSGNPLYITPDDAYNSKSIPFISGIFPSGSKLYLTSFSWTYTPPNVPNVSYSFLFAYNGGGGSSGGW